MVKPNKMAHMICPGLGRFPLVASHVFQNWIADIIENIDDELVHEKVKNEVSSLTSEYPVYRL